MAFVTRLDEISSEHARRQPTSVDCEAFSFVDAETGERLLQLNTYGSPERKKPGGVSQTIQLNQEVAEQLARLISKTFPPNSPQPFARMIQWREWGADDDTVSFFEDTEKDARELISKRFGVEVGDPAKGLAEGREIIIVTDSIVTKADVMNR